ncbi:MULTISPECIES: hypothetical protein [Pseudomonas]|uniref:hypothetical protein n=1 Tax=Pseudomonas TaxID=286 RepID=UPI00089DD3D0|nr:MULTISPECIES: hypothetical protein [Pseudomonas]NMY75556.1 hypothetical protein [Pseudomonas sp. WS 5071]NMZ96671.1 hypothetical protein [Pseudomonas lundensis]
MAVTLRVNRKTFSRKTKRGPLSFMLQGAGFSGMDLSGLFLGEVTCLRLSMDEKLKSTTHSVSFAASQETLVEAEDERARHGTPCKGRKTAQALKQTLFTLP